MSIYGYIHATTDTADYHTQHFSILAFASNNSFGQVHFCSEPVHGNKCVLSGILSTLLREDALIVTDFSKLGSTTGEVLNALLTLSRRGVRLYIVKSGFRLDDNAQALVVATACSLVAQIEKEVSCYRVTVADVKEQPKAEESPAPRPLARRSRLDGNEEEIRALLCGEVSLSEIARKLKVSRPALTDFIESRNITV